MRLTRPLEEGYHTLGYSQWTGKEDENRRKGTWYIDVKVNDGRITAIREMGQKKWYRDNLPALIFEEDDEWTQR